jgi:hypothetical protein
MPDALPEKRRLNAGSEEQRNVARAMGQVCMRVLVTWNNPGAPKEEVREKLKTNWSESRKEYTRLGLTIVRQLEGMGYKITKVPGATGDDAGSEGQPDNGNAG